MEVLAVLGVVVGLVVLLVWTSRRWAPPRLFAHRTTALWLVAAILAVVIVILLLVLD
ncbi:MAG TPA: hypothetical protein VFO03_13060 [Gaiellaceae bacterium]|nr:hypothetical protein [Gaiellaceae bacterium]